MAEAFSNSLTRAVGIVSSVTGGAIGIGTNLITGITTVGIATGYIVDNTNYILGTRVTGYGKNTGEVVVDRDSTNTASASSQVLTFLGLTSAYTSAAGTKAILIGGTFANNTDSAVNLTVEVHDSSSNTVVGLAQKIPVPTGSSFVISDAGKSVLEATDSLRVYCDVANAIDVNLSILTGVS
tara:strand:- start:33 stop:578 length:546 start_codon:yes stop_codon:yes gene_type:complete